MPRKSQPQHRRGRSKGPPSSPIPPYVPPNTDAPTPTRRSSRPPKKFVRWANPTAGRAAPPTQPATSPAARLAAPARPAPQEQATPNPIIRPVPRKPARLRWGPSDTRQRVTMNQAAQRAAQALLAPMQDDNGQDKDQEETQEEDDTDDLDAELERREEEDLEACQEQPYLYRVSFVLKALLGKTKRTKWQGKIGIEDWVTGAFDTDSLDLELGKAIDRCNFEDELLEIVISVKSDYSKGTRKFTSLAEISHDIWDSKVESLLRQEHTRFPGYKLEVIVEYTGKIISEDNANRKRSLISVDSLSKSPIPRRTRTVQQEEAIATRRDKNKEVGDFSEKLINR
jgi:hypothetical protein